MVFMFQRCERFSRIPEFRVKETFTSKLHSLSPKYISKRQRLNYGNLRLKVVSVRQKIRIKVPPLTLLIKIEVLNKSQFVLRFICGLKLRL